MNRPHLVPYARKWYRLRSVQIMSIQSSVILAWSQLPEDLRTAIPPWVLASLAIGLLALGVFGAITIQEKVHQNVDP